MTTKREEAEQAMRLGPTYATEEARVALLREAINEALEEAAKMAESMGRGWGILRSMEMTSHARAAVKVAAGIRALKKEGS